METTRLPILLSLNNLLNKFHMRNQAEQEVGLQSTITLTLKHLGLLSTIYSAWLRTCHRYLVPFPEYPTTAFLISQKYKGPSEFWLWHCNKTYNHSWPPYSNPNSYEGGPQDYMQRQKDPGLMSRTWVWALILPCNKQELRGASQSLWVSNPSTKNKALFILNPYGRIFVRIQWEQEWKRWLPACSSFQTFVQEFAIFLSLQSLYFIAILIFHVFSVFIS